MTILNIMIWFVLRPTKKHLLQRPKEENDLSYMCTFLIVYHMQFEKCLGHVTPKKIMGFGGLPKQPRLSKEILAISSVFQVCFKCVNFFYHNCISISLNILIILLLIQSK